MSPHDTLRDRLEDAAAPTSTPLPNARQLRTRAVRHRNQRRAVAGSVVLVAAAAVAVAGSTLLGPRTTSIGPATPPPVTTSATPAPTTEPAPTTSAAPPSPSAPASPTAPATIAGPPAVSPAQAQAFVEELRFEDEAVWAEDLDFPPTVGTEVEDFQAHSCGGDPVQAPGVLAMRTVVRPGADTGSTRQLSVFGDAQTAAEAFDQVRATIRACQAARTGPVEGQEGIERSYVGGQLTLGDESFWVGTKELVVSASSGFEPGFEMYFSTAAVMVLDRNVITVIDDPASSDEMRATVVEEATAEWERLRPTLEPVLR